MAKRTSSGTKRKKSNRLFEQINLHAAGIDAGKDEHWVAVPEDRCDRPVRSFSTNTAGLFELADWLVENGITTVAVEATGVYCGPLLEVLDARQIEVKLIKPSSLKAVNDTRKTDVLDCQWIQILHSFGLLRGAFRPEAQVAKLRTYMRHRRMLIEHSSTAIEQIKKALIVMNVRLDRAVSDITGRTGMDIIRAILKGERDPYVLATFRQGSCAKSEDAIAEDLRGTWKDDHLFALSHAVRTWDHYQALILECNQQIEAHLQTFDRKAAGSDIPKPRRKEHVRKQVFTFDARTLLYEILGVDLTQIDGISTSTVATFVSELGTDVSAWPTFRHMGSWLRVCPGSRVSGGKRLSSRNAPSANRAATALRVAAQSLETSQSALGAYYRRMKARLGPQKAINATAYKLARMIYVTLKTGRPYVDPGPDYYRRKNESRALKRLEKQARSLGYTLTKTA